MEINLWKRWYCLVCSQSRRERTHAHKYAQPKRLWTKQNCSSARWCASMSRPWDRTLRSMTVSTCSRINYQQQYWILCFAGYLGESVLLFVWLLIPCVCYSGGILCSDIHSNGLLPTMWRGKSLQKTIWDYLVWSQVGSDVGIYFYWTSCELGIWILAHKSNPLHATCKGLDSWARIHFPYSHYVQ